MTQKLGKLAEKLIAAGWTRSDVEGHPGECGSPPYCMRPARWTRPGSGRPMCAQHAAMLDAGTLNS